MSATAVPMETVTVEIDRVFDATLDRIWQMFTDPAEIAVWGCGDWYDNVALDLDLRVGGVIHHRVISRNDGSAWTFHGVYYEVDEKERLAYSFDWKTDWRDDPAPSRVAVDFSPADDGKVRVKLTHSDVASPGADATHAHWNHFLDRLAELV